jgi:hypothetical protein
MCISRLGSLISFSPPHPTYRPSVNWDVATPGYEGMKASVYKDLMARGQLPAPMFGVPMVRSCVCRRFVIVEPVAHVLILYFS